MSEILCECGHYYEYHAISEYGCAAETAQDETCECKGWRDTYTPGDPIFEHGGESEREFAEHSYFDDQRIIALSVHDHADYAIRCLRLGQEWKPHRHFIWAYRYARELERRRLNNE